MQADSGVDGKNDSELSRQKALFDTDAYNYYSPSPVIAVCIASSLIYTGIVVFLGLFDKSRLHYYLVPPFVCCFVSASLAEKMRIRSIATVFVYLMVVGLCILAAGYAGSAYTIYFEGVIGVCLAMIFVCISEGIVGFCLNDRYSIEAKAGLVRAVLSILLIPILLVVFKVVPSLLMAAPGASIIAFSHIAIWAKLKAVVDYKNE